MIRQLLMGRTNVNVKRRKENVTVLYYGNLRTKRTSVFRVFPTVVLSFSFFPKFLIIKNSHKNGSPS